jgi:hypothetical protein
MVVACLALGIALAGTSYAAIKLPANSVGAKQLKKNAVTGPKIKGNAVTSPKVKDDALTGADISEATLGTVPSATSATNATNATTAANATKVAGRNVLCPAGTVEFLGQCFETTLRTGVSIFDASDTCKAAGGYLGNVMMLRSGRGGSPLTLSATGEWADSVDNDETDGNRGTTIKDNGGFAEVSTIALTPYRCVFSLIRVIGAGPGNTLRAPKATRSDGS